jgi:hypothetical protein
MTDRIAPSALLHLIRRGTSSRTQFLVMIGFRPVRCGIAVKQPGWLQQQTSAK